MSGGHCFLHGQLPETLPAELCLLHGLLLSPQPSELTETWPSELLLSPLHFLEVSSSPDIFSGSPSFAAWLQQILIINIVNMEDSFSRFYLIDPVENQFPSERVFLLQHQVLIFNIINRETASADFT